MPSRCGGAADGQRDAVEEVAAGDGAVHAELTITAGPVARGDIVMAEFFPSEAYVKARMTFLPVASQSNGFECQPVPAEAMQEEMR